MDWVTVARHIDYGKGVAASHTGVPYNVYRVGTGLTATTFLDPTNLIYPNFRVWREPTHRADWIEGPEHFGTFFYRFIGDATNLFLGDVFSQNDTFFGTGDTGVDFTTIQFNGMCLASHVPEKETIAARLDRTCNIYRLSPSPDATGFWDATLNEAQPLVLANGTFSLGAVDTVGVCNIPIGVQSVSRGFGPLIPKLPTTTGTTHWFIYVPPLPGFNFREGDRIVTDGGTLATGSRYVVEHPYAQQTGFVGSQLVCTREVAPT